MVSHSNLGICGFVSMSCEKYFVLSFFTVALFICLSGLCANNITHEVGLHLANDPGCALNLEISILNTINFVLMYICTFLITPFATRLVFGHISSRLLLSASFCRMVNSQTDTSTNSAIEASAPSSTGSSVLMDTGLDLSSNTKEEGSPVDPSQRSQSQYMEDKEMLDTKKDQQFG